MKCTSQIVSNCTQWFYGICSYWSKTQMSDISTLAIVKCCSHVIGSVSLPSSFRIAVSWVSGPSSIFLNSWLKLLALLFKNQDELMLHYASFREAWPQLLSLLVGLLVLGFSRRRLVEFLQEGVSIPLLKWRGKSSADFYRSCRIGGLEEGRPVMWRTDTSSFPPASNAHEFVIWTKCTIKKWIFMFLKFKGAMLMPRAASPLPHHPWSSWSVLLVPTRFQTQQSASVLPKGPCGARAWVEPSAMACLSLSPSTSSDHEWWQQIAMVFKVFPPLTPE